MRSYRAIVSLVSACLSVGLAAQAFGATIDANNLPYTPSDMTDFTQGNTGAGGTWSNTFENNILDNWSGSSSAAVVNTTGVAGQNFTVKTDFQVKTFYGGSLILGASALSDNENLGGDWNGNKFYAATVRFDDNGNRSLDIDTNNPSYYSSSILTGGPQAVSWATTGVTYSLTMHGVYDGSGNLTLSATLVDTLNPANTLTVAAPQIAAGDIGTGTNFGLRNCAYNAGGGDVQFSNFSISNAVPEPTSLGFLAVGALGLMARRRKLA